MEKKSRRQRKTEAYVARVKASIKARNQAKRDSEVRVKAFCLTKHVTQLIPTTLYFRRSDIAKHPEYYSGVTEGYFIYEKPKLVFEEEKRANNAMEALEKIKRGY